MKMGVRNDKRVNKNYFIYILASKRNGTLYVGISNDLKTRVYQHKND